MRSPHLLAVLALAACSVKPINLTEGADAAAAAADVSVAADSAPLADAAALEVAGDPSADTAADDGPVLVPDATVLTDLLATPDRAADRRTPPDLRPDPIDPLPDADQPEPDAAPPDTAPPPPDAVPDTAPPPPDVAPDAAAPPDAAPDLAPDAAPSPQGSELVFVANQDSNDISVFVVNAMTGEHAAAPGSPFATGERPFHLAITPNGRFLYACHYGSEDVRGFRVADGGKLTPLPSAPAPMPHPEVIVAGPGGHLYGYGVDGLLYGFTIEASTGALHAITGSPFAGITTINGLAADPRGRYLAVTARTDSNGAGTLRLFSVDAAGTPVLAAELAAPGLLEGDSPALAFNPTGDFLYGAVTTPTGGDRIFGYVVPATPGPLTAIPGGPWLGTSEPHAIAFHPFRPLVYYAGVGDMRIFTRADSGSLTEVSGSPVIFNNDTGAVVSSLGHFLYVLYQSENEITVSRIAESGLPEPFAGSPWKTGLNPFHIVVWGPPLL